MPLSDKIAPPVTGPQPIQMSLSLQNAWDGWGHVPGNDKANVTAFGNILLNAADDEMHVAFKREAAEAVIGETWPSSELHQRAQKVLAANPAASAPA